MACLHRQAPDVAEYVYHWRSSMEYFMMKHFRLCLTLLETKFDAVGAASNPSTLRCRPRLALLQTRSRPICWTSLPADRTLPVQELR